MMAPQPLPEGLRGDGPCADCGTTSNIIWFTASAVWNAVMDPVDGRYLILCIPCFAKRAHAVGHTAWQLVSTRAGPGEAPRVEACGRIQEYPHNQCVFLAGHDWSHMDAETLLATLEAEYQRDLANPRGGELDLRDALLEYAETLHEFQCEAAFDVESAECPEPSCVNARRLVAATPLSAREKLVSHMDAAIIYIEQQDYAGAVNVLRDAIELGGTGVKHEKIELRSGGTISLWATIDLVALSRTENDRAFLFGLLETLAAYEPADQGEES